MKREREEDARFGGSGTLDVDGESDGESDEAESDLTDPDSQTPSRSSPAGRGSPKKASYFKRLVRGSNELTAVHSVKDFGAAFNKDRKSQARMLMRAGVFGLDKPLVQQNGERVGEMCWYSRARAYGTLNIVYNDGFSRFSQEAGALLKQAGSFVSMATVGKTVKTLGVGDFLSSKVEAAVDVGKRRAVNVVEAVLGETKQKLCDDLTKDRDMPNGVRKVFQSVVGVYFSEVQQEVLDELARRLKTLSYSEKKQTRRKRDKQSILLQIGISTWYEYFTLKYLRKLALDFRAWYLYNELPYDKSFWGKLRSPGWWLILTTKLYSGWGIQAFLYAMRLLMLDRTDEWQLFEYISNFKGIQFLSGVIAMFQGVLMYMECAGLVTQSSPHTCHVNGPGSDQKGAVRHRRAVEHRVRERGGRGVFHSHPVDVVRVFPDAPVVQLRQTHLQRSKAGGRGDRDPRDSERHEAELEVATMGRRVRGGLRRLRARRREEGVLFHHRARTDSAGAVSRRRRRGDRGHQTKRPEVDRAERGPSHRVRQSQGGGVQRQIRSTHHVLPGRRKRRARPGRG